MNNLISKQRVFLIRRSDKTFDETFNSEGYLFEDVIGLDDIPNMSMNLSGLHFEPGFIRYRPKMNTKAVEGWQGGFTILLSQYLDDYEELRITTPVFFDAAELHDKQIPVDINKDKDGLKTLKQLKIIDKIEEENKFIIKYSSAIEHSPLNLNYWHVHLVIADPNGKEVKKLNATHKKAAEYMFSHFITRMALREIPVDAVVIPTDSYIQ